VTAVSSAQSSGKASSCRQALACPLALSPPQRVVVNDCENIVICIYLERETKIYAYAEGKAYIYIYIARIQVQELVFRFDGYNFGWFMTLWELLIFVVAAWVQLVQDKRYDEITTIKWREYVNLTIVLAITQGSGSAALSYVNFPVKVVFKSCKLIPTVSVNTAYTSVMR